MKKKKEMASTKHSPVYDLQHIKPLTVNQKRTFELYNKHNLILTGYAGTGKTFISIYLALQQIMQGNTDVDHMIIVRSAVATRDVGFMPGSLKEKTKLFEAPYYDIFEQLLDHPDGYDIMKQKDMVHFMTTSYIRGITLSNCIVIIDECQNLSFHELDSIVTRLGENTKLILCGDFFQSDLKSREKTGLRDFINIIESVSSFKTIEFEADDIVRSKLVKDYIIAKTEYFDQDKKIHAQFGQALLTE